MKMILVALFVCVVGLQVAVGQIIESGKCPKVKPEKHFDSSKHFGKYYEFASYDGALRKGHPECIVYNVQVPDGKKNAQGFLSYPYTRDLYFATRPMQKVKGEAFAKNSDPTTLGKFDVIFKELAEGVIEMNILKTADHFQVVFYCQELPSNKHLSHAIVFTRAPSPSPADVDAIKSVLKNNNIDFKRLKTHNHHCEKHVHRLTNS